MKAAQLYDWKTVAAAYGRLYDDVVKTSSTRPARPAQAVT